MKRFFRLSFVALALFTAAVPAQVANVTVGSGPNFDSRPFGKYLVAICTLSPDQPNDQPCVSTSPSANLSKTPQTITIKQVGCAAGVTPCPDPKYPLHVGDTFYVSATSDSGLPVTQDMISGHATLGPADKGVQQYAVTAEGTVVIRATQAGDSSYAPAPYVLLTLNVSTSASDDSDASCSGLFGPVKPAALKQIDLAGIVTLIGNPTPFVLSAQGKYSIFIYSTRYPLNSSENALRDSIGESIARLAGRTADSLGVSQPFTVELSIPHASALGDLATRIGGLNYSQFTVQDIGSDRVRIKASSQPDCTTWKAFLSAIRHMEWQVSPEPFGLKLYYLSSTDVATAFTALGAAPSGSSGASGAGGSPGGSSGSPGGGGSTTGASTIAVNQPPGSVVELKSDTTPCVVAGLTLSNSSACAPASGTSSPSASPSGGSGGASTAAPQPPAMAAMGVAAGSVEQTPSDLLVFSDAHPGDDAGIQERKRVLALLDLPRPEMMINAWVMQNSTADARAMGAFTSTVRDLVGGYNDAVEELVLRGWGSVKQQSEEPGYFNKPFYHYIADTFVADPVSGAAPSTAQDAAQNFLNFSPAKMADPPDTLTREFGICKTGRYCLGYGLLFHPLKPRLTDFLLTLIAAENPRESAERAVREVEITSVPVTSENQCDAREFASGERRERCHALWNNTGLGRRTPSSKITCAEADYMYILGSLLYFSPDDTKRHPAIYLTCFRQAADKYMGAAGLLRAAIADFLFNYKMSQQYPHEFAAYDLSQSADRLNTALRPLIDGFNRDIVAYQTFMRADVQYRVERLNSRTDQRCCVKRLFGLDKPSFFNDGLVTVNTISGQPTVVNTTSASALDASSAPSLASLVNSIATPGSSTGTSPVASVLGSGQAPASLLAGVLNAYQATVAQIGRQLNISVTPRSLSTASSAELSVTLNADETAGGTVYSGAGAASANTSRVASHDTTTRIRVESVKLFEVSSLSAIVERSRSRFPLLPPFVEIPYIGTILGIPIPAAKEYHSSTAVMSAMVVPTAADLAYGLTFTFDRVVDADQGTTTCSYIQGSAGPSVEKPCKFRKAISIGDLSNPISSFHKAMVNCFATNMTSPYSSFESLGSTDTIACDGLSFTSVRQDEH